jgi:NADH dehydrogenase [ubiquinone] 1 alpha subcomplex assembly factor 1
MKNIIFVFLVLFSFSMQSQNLEIINSKNAKGMGNWRIINDNVMGGISNSTMSQNSSGELVFKGSVSLENNGGFASCRLDISGIDLAGVSSFILRVKGDGKIYQFRVGAINNYANYCFDFETKKDQWLDVNIPINKLTPRIMGRYSPQSPEFKIEMTRRIGFLISNKQQGEFNLEIMSVKGSKTDINL